MKLVSNFVTKVVQTVQHEPLEENTRAGCDWWLIWAKVSDHVISV
jgi:hypothetical protein